MKNILFILLLFSSLLRAQEGGPIIPLVLYETSATNLIGWKSQQDGKYIYVAGTATAGDGGAGFFKWDAASTATDDGVNVIQAYLEMTPVDPGRWLRVSTPNILNNGNSFSSTVTLGTNDNNSLALETNAITRATISTNGAWTATDITSNTNTIETAHTYIVNSSGTVNSTGFGLRHLYQLETTTTDAQSAIALDYYWVNGTHASRGSGWKLSNVTNAGSLTERLKIEGGTLSMVGQYVSTAYALTDGATIAVDWENGNIQTVTLGG